MIDIKKLKEMFHRERLSVTTKEILAFEGMVRMMLKGWVEMKIVARDGERANHPSQPPSCS